MSVSDVCGATLTFTTLAGFSRLPVSSTARLLMVVGPTSAGFQVYLQLLWPVAGCQVIPPSTETSTPPIVPSPSLQVVPVIGSHAVPVISIGTPTVGFDGSGAIFDLGGVASVEAAARERPD